MSDCLLSAHFLHWHGKMTIIMAYAPTDVTEDTVKDDYYDQLKQVLGQIPPHDITLILANANATISSSAKLPDTDPLQTQPIGTTFANPSTNNNGNCLLLLC